MSIGAFSLPPPRPTGWQKSPSLVGLPSPLGFRSVQGGVVLWFLGDFDFSKGLIILLSRCFSFFFFLNIACLGVQETKIQVLHKRQKSLSHWCGRWNLWLLVGSACLFQLIKAATSSGSQNPFAYFCTPLSSKLEAPITKLPRASFSFLLQLHFYDGVSRIFHHLPPWSILFMPTRFTPIWSKK